MLPLNVNRGDAITAAWANSILSELKRLREIRAGSGISVANLPNGIQISAIERDRFWIGIVRAACGSETPFDDNRYVVVPARCNNTEADDADAMLSLEAEPSDSTFYKCVVATDLRAMTSQSRLIPVDSPVLVYEMPDMGSPYRIRYVIVSANQNVSSGDGTTTQWFWIDIPYKGYGEPYLQAYVNDDDWRGKPLTIRAWYAWQGTTTTPEDARSLVWSRATCGESNSLYQAQLMFGENYSSYIGNIVATVTFSGIGSMFLLLEEDTGKLLFEVRSMFSRLQCAFVIESGSVLEGPTHTL